MNILEKAIKLFNNEDYKNALTLFEQAGSIYGEHLVEFNIQKCRKALNFRSPKEKPLRIMRAEFDPATSLMQANAGQLHLDEAERAALMNAYSKARKRKSADAIIKPANLIPADWPNNLVLAALPDGPNDYEWNLQRKKIQGIAPSTPDPLGLSVIVPTYNRSRILDVTLACLSSQESSYPFEVIVADDGSQESLEPIIRKYEKWLDIKYVRQKDYGYQLCAVRNLGLRTAKYQFVSILDCDMAPNSKWVHSYIENLLTDDDVALIGPRKYVDTSGHDSDLFRKDANLITALPEIMSGNSVSSKMEKSVSVDWRLEHFKATEDLRLCQTPFRFFSGGNVAFSKKWLDKAGWFDEAFTHWGGEDNEFAYRLFRAGCFFRVVHEAMAYHQEPPGKENETDRAEGRNITINIVKEKVPYYYRRPSAIQNAKIHIVPMVSIYIPAYNCEDTIVRCVNSALNQTIVDLEVCICNDGSTDKTAEVLDENFAGHPRVRILHRQNGGIGAASNDAVKMARGWYIGQLDSDDYLEPDAVELCLNEFFSNRNLVCVYTANRNVNPDGTLIANGYNWPEFSREKFITAMIVHHFRMFTARAWNLTAGFDASIINAVDYDIYLKLSEVGDFRHINKIAYNRVLHGSNTSIRRMSEQKENHFKVINRALSRQGVSGVTISPSNEAPESRNYCWF